MTRTYRTPEQVAADCLGHAERYERLSQPRNAEAHRVLAAEARTMAGRIAVVLSVEMEGQGK